MKTTIVSIDTGDPRFAESTSAVVRTTFDGVKIDRSAIVYTGSFEKQKERILSKCAGADFIIIEKIDSTNKYLARSVIEEQINLMKFLQENGCNVNELIRSGRKEIITDALLKQIQLWSEGPHETHHNDVREATRNGLYFMVKDEELNKILSNYVQHFFQ